jgi:hypothetical protein
MGALVSSLAKSIKLWFTSTPDEYNPTNDHIRNHHKMQEEEPPYQAEEEEEVKVTPYKYGRERHSYGVLPVVPIRQYETISHNSDSESLQVTSGPGPSSSALVHFSPPPQLLSLLEKGPIQPKIWPTKEEFQLAKKRIQYDPEKLHFAVCGGSGTGKSSLINSFCGLKNKSSTGKAAGTGVDETTMAITRYPDPREELPYKRFVWYDCPGAGTLKTPGWQYFNQQGLFIFDVIILVYDTVIIPINLSNAD